FDIDLASAQDAMYEIQLTNDNAYILTKRESSNALFKRDKSAEQFLLDVESFCKWISVGELENPKSKITKDDLIFTMTKIEGQDFDEDNINTLVGTEKEIIPGEETVFKYVDGHQPAYRFSVRLRDGVNKNYFAAALQMYCMYGIKTDLIAQDNNQLSSNTNALQLIYRNEGKTYNAIPLSMGDLYEVLKLNEATEFLKIFIATESVNLDRYQQDDLEMEPPPIAEKTRAGKFEKQSIEDKFDWNVFTFPIKMIRLDKQKDLDAKTPADFGAFTIEVPEGFSATAFTATGDDIQKKLSRPDRGADADYDMLAQMLAPPAGIWGEVITEPDAFDAGMSAGADNDIKVVELTSPAENKLQLVEGQELLIKPKTLPTRATRNDGLIETTVPYGFDKTLNLFIPLGYTDEDGVIHIQRLPAASDTIIQDDGPPKRSIIGSVKLFFKKIFTAGNANKLTLYEIDPNTGWNELTDKPGEMTAVFDKDPQAPVLLLIHGIFGSMKDITGSLKEAADLPKATKYVLAYDYENLSTPLKKTGKKLADDLKTAGFGTIPGLQLSVVAHSMGGLVARRLIESEGASTFVKRMIFAGSPNGGSELAELKRSLSGMLTHALNVTGPLKYAVTGISFLIRKLEVDPGETLEEMSPGSDFLKELAISKQPTNISYSILAGDTALIRDGYNGNDHFLKTLGAAMKSNLVYPGLTWSLFHDNKNDMAVTLDSMKTIMGFDNARMHVVANDHLSYFSEKACQDKLIELLCTWK
ncbi:MAG TPA: hypothetical protein VKH37_08575, partial [Ferruginibacter sp.]|nr:hypothetical protein [Ferruginibacter sp.]